MNTGGTGSGTRKPHVGQDVLFTLDKQTCEQIQETGGRTYIPGEQIAGKIVGLNPNSNTCNLILFPDGPKTMYIAGVEYGTTNRNRSWTWPPRVEGGTGGEAGTAAA